MKTFYRVLTPPGSAAVAVIALEGPNAQAIVRDCFRRANGQPLSEQLPTGFTYGRFGTTTADEVVLRIHRDGAFEIHAHGGYQVVSWLVQLLRERGCEERIAEPADPWNLLPFARTTRTAAILLDQCYGAYEKAVAEVDAGNVTVRELLQRNVNVGRHLLEPWRVAIAGLPNAGKSSLMNALAGFDRSIVSPIPGTTRDAVAVSLAFAGWPVDLVDTAGLRESPDDLEREGVQRAQDAIAACDLCIWLTDATDARPAPSSLYAKKLLHVYNKVDLVTVPPQGLCVSAKTGAGLKELIAHLVTELVPHPPQAGEPVPYTRESCDRWSAIE